MDDKSKLELNEKLKTEREISDKSYAPMQIKTIVYTFIAMICTAFIAFLTKIAWTIK